MSVETLLRYDAFAWHYEATIGDRAFDDDLNWYAGRVLPLDAPVLELACGTGRVALSLARRGLNVVGLDFSEPMLRIARRKAARLGLQKRTAFIRGAMQHFDLPGRFGSICIPFASLSLLLTAREQGECLAAIRHHLAPRGRLLLDMNFFDRDTALSRSRFREWDAPVYDPERRAWVSRRARSVRMRAPDVIEYEFIYRCQYEDGGEDQKTVPFAFNTLSPIDVISRLESNGFTVIEATNGLHGRTFRTGDGRVFVTAVPQAPRTVISVPRTKAG